jgi:hypothetical protein
MHQTQTFVHLTTVGFTPSSGDITRSLPLVKSINDEDLAARVVREIDRMNSLREIPEKNIVAAILIQVSFLPLVEELAV